jgi:Cyclic nucleotide-binding domain
LLCSDGLHHYLKDSDVPEILTADDIADAPKTLVALANAGGGHDNITAVVIRVGDTAQAGDAPRTTDVTQKLDVLKGMQMFRFLSYKELVKVGAIADVVELTGGSTIFAAGEPGDNMYVVASGTVRLLDKDKLVAELSRGQHFGEMSLVDRSMRSLTAIASSDKVRLVSIGRKEFYDLIKREPASAVKVLWAFVQVLGQRLRKTTSDLSDALHGDKHGEESEQENLFQD